MKKTTEERFWAKVDKRGKDECWPWTAGRHKGDMGWFNAKNSPLLAHRWLWEHLHGEVPENMCVLHSCRHPWCCNPDHLFLGTRQDVIHPENRTPFNIGEDNPMARLTEDGVRAIRRSSHTVDWFAYKLGVHRNTVYLARIGKTWKGVK